MATHEEIALILKRMIKTSKNALIYVFTINGNIWMMYGQNKMLNV